MSEWQPIATAPKTRRMIVVQAFNIERGWGRYTSDPYCVWWSGTTEEWVRWPHEYQPTHWLALPDDPEALP